MGTRALSDALMKRCCSVFLALLVGFLVSASASAQTPPPVSFIARMDYAVAADSQGVQVGDLNSDGNLDLVTISSNGTVSVLLGTASGVFQPAVNFTVPASGGLQLGDFNGDGILDILIATASTTSRGIASVSVLLGNGDGTFQSAKTTTVASSNGALGVGDFNGDGLLDLVILAPVPQLGDSSVTVMLGNGDGTFQAQTTGNATAVATPSMMEVADLNADGKPDLVMLLSTGVTVFLGNGDGTFQNPKSSTEPFASFAIADFNGDGKPDLALSGNSDTWIALGNGDGTFQAAVVAADSPVGGTPMVADVNGDGIPDLVSPLAVMLGMAGEKFQPPLYIPGLSAASFAVVGDFNKDGKLDIAVTGPAPNNIVGVLFGNGDGTFQTDAFTADPGGFGSSIVSGDFNGDGLTDLLSVTGNSRSGAAGPTALYVGSGSGTFTVEPLIITSQNFGICQSAFTSFALCPIAAGDFNNDGKLDFVVTGDAGTVGVFLNNATTTFNPITYGGGGTSIVTADLTGSGIQDLITSGGTANNFSITLGNGDGTFGFPTTFPMGSAANWVAVGDFNGDAKLDLAVATGTSVAILLGNGDGTFGSSAINSPTDAGSAMVAIGDFNGDGKVDVATANSTANDVSILLGNGNGTFQAPVNYPVLTSPTFLAVADLNGDGKEDLAVLDNRSSNTTIESDVSVLLGNGDGTFQPAVNFGTQGQSWLDINDFNGDGSPDIAVAGVSILLNRSSGPAGQWSPGLVAFGGAAVGSTVSGTATLKNTGTKTLNITFVVLVGTQGSDFTETNNCGSSLAVGTSCSLNLSFTPSALGQETALVLVQDNAFNTPQVLTLSGSGVTTAPSVSLSPGTLSFANQTVDTGSAPQTVTLTNTGNASLSVTAIAVSGTNASEFKETNTCGSSVAAGAKCTITITFTPAATGSRSATLTITDNASNSPQNITLSGTGATASLGLGVPSSGSSTATVTAGQTASYTLSIGGAGFSGAANLSCTGAPTGATCSVPSTENLTATTATTFTVSVSTTSRTSATLDRLSHPSLRWMWAFALLGMFIVPSAPNAKGKAQRVLRWLPLTLLLFICSCGGGSSSSSPPPTNPNGTPAGQYTLTVTATSGSTTQSTKLTLTVQ